MYILNDKRINYNLSTLIYCNTHFILLKYCSIECVTKNKLKHIINKYISFCDLLVNDLCSKIIMFDLPWTNNGYRFQ